MSGATMTPIDLGALAAWATRQRFSYRVEPEQLRVVIDYHLLGQPAPLYLIVHEDRPMLTLAMRMPFTVPETEHDSMVLALTPLNSHIHMGAWVLNTDSGEVFFRATVPTVDAVYGDAAILFCAQAVVGTAEAFVEKLAAVARRRAAS